MTSQSPLNMGEKIQSMLELESTLFDKAHKIALNLNRNNIEFKKDIRYTTFNTLSSVVRYARINLIFREQFLENNGWWDSNYGEYFSYLDSYFGIGHNDRIRMRLEVRQNISNDFVKTMIVGLYASSFSIMESRFRIFYNYFIEPDKKGEIKADGNISDLSRLLLTSLGMCHKKRCIRLFSNIRNTVHNNGIYTKHSEIIEYGGRPYVFLKNRPSHYGDSLDLLILVILPEVIQILDTTVTRLLPEHHIVDPFAV